MPNIKDMLHKQAAQIFSQTVEHYRYLHQHPELSHREQNTSRYIADFLATKSIPYRNNIGGYGIIATIKGAKPDTSKTIALVADMDALPVHEENDVPYRSRNEGVMHACGHDSHTAALMAAAVMINANKGEFGGVVQIVFQPGEEQSPGGASLMLNDGVFSEREPDFVVKQHAYIDLPAGHVAFQTGIVMASADEVHITVYGQGGHGALPHELNDTVLAASNIVVAMQQIVSRRRNPFSPMTLSFGRFIADGATNVIPSKVVIAGSLRCMDEVERSKMLAVIPEIAESVAQAYGCSCNVDLPEGYPCTISHADTTELIRQLAVDHLGDENVGEYPRRMTAEDFGFFSQQYPACFYRFGVSPLGGTTGKLHSSTFLIDEQALLTASGTLAYIALKSIMDE